MDTLLLDQKNWDLVLDVNGNIAVASAPYAIAQDVASAIKLFEGELWYETAKGLPYWNQILGHRPPLSLVKSKMEAAALAVPGVVSSRVIFDRLDGRTLTGQIQVTDANSVTSYLTF